LAETKTELFETDFSWASGQLAFAPEAVSATEITENNSGASSIRNLAAGTI
jgi:hypothetical protein